MNRSSIFSLSFATLGASLILAAGCGKQASGPQLDPEGLPLAIHSLEKSARTILDACEEGDAASAHRPLHSIGKQAAAVGRLIGVAGLGKTVEEAMSSSLETLKSGFAEIDDALHESEEAEVSSETIAKLREALGSLRTALPASVLAEVKKLDDAAAERAAKAEEVRAKAAADAPSDDSSNEKTPANEPPAEDSAQETAEESETPETDTPEIEDTPGVDAAADPADEVAADAGPALTP